MVNFADHVTKHQIKIVTSPRQFCLISERIESQKKIGRIKSGKGDPTIKEEGLKMGAAYLSFVNGNSIV